MLDSWKVIFSGFKKFYSGWSSIDQLQGEDSDSKNLSYFLDYALVIYQSAEVSKDRNGFFFKEQSKKKKRFNNEDQLNFYLEKRDDVDIWRVQEGDKISYRLRNFDGGMESFFSQKDLQNRLAHLYEDAWTEQELGLQEVHYYQKKTGWFSSLIEEISIEQYRWHLVRQENEASKNKIKSAALIGSVTLSFCANLITKTVIENRDVSLESLNINLFQMHEVDYSATMITAGIRLISYPQVKKSGLLFSLYSLVSFANAQPWISMMPANFSLSNLNGVNGLAFLGDTFGSRVGVSVNSAGDINGDGKADLIVSNDDVAGYTGIVYLVYSGSWLHSPTFLLSSLNGTTGVKIIGDLFGACVNSGIDFNGDGKTDLIIGASGANDYTGAVYLIYGGPWLNNATFSVSSLNGTNGVKILGVSYKDATGSSVDAADDINGDDKMDLIIGAYGADNNNGAVYIVYGGPWLNNDTFSLSTLNGTNGVKIISNSFNRYTGISVSSAGDVDGNGKSDLIVAALSRTQHSLDMVYLIYSGIWLNNVTFSLSNLNGTNGVKISGGSLDNGLGYSVSSVGDINGDGKADLIIGASVSSVDFAAYLVYGGPWLNHPTFLMSDLNGTNGIIIIDSSRLVAQYGSFVTSVNDLNGDNKPEIIIGIPDGSSSIKPSLVYLIYSGPWLGKSNFITSALNGTNGITFIGTSAGDYVGYSVSSTGDVNGDGKPDLLIGAPGFDSTHIGTAYLIYGDGNFTLWKNQLILSRGDTVIFNVGMINATGVLPASLVITINNVQNGYFQFILNPGQSVTTFTLEQIDLGQVSFVHDAGSPIAPSYSISIENRQGLYQIFEPIPAQINFTQNPPFLTKNNFSILRGQTFTLDENNFNSTDVVFEKENVTYRISNAQYGFFSFVSQANNPVFSFTQDQVNQGIVQFTHDGSALPPLFMITLSDPGMAIDPIAGDIQFDQHPPGLKENNLSVHRRQSLLIDTSQLNSNNVAFVPGQVVFSLTFVQHGFFSLVSEPNTRIVSFTQSQLDQNQVFLTHDGGPLSPSFSVSVSDPGMASSLIPGVIYFNQNPPTLLSNRLSLLQGQVLVLNFSFLEGSSLAYNSSDVLIFGASLIKQGHFELANNPGFPVLQFSQKQVEDNNVIFKHDGTGNPPSYNVTFSDPGMSTSSSAVQVDFTAVPPKVLNNRLSIIQGHTIILSTDQLSVSGANFYGSQNLKIIMGKVAHGVFSNTSFLQEDLSQVSFTHDGSVFSPNYTVSIVDGLYTYGPFAPDVSFDQPPALTINFLNVSKGGTVVLTLDNLKATDPDDPATSLVFLVKNLQRGEFFLRDRKNPVTQFSQVQLMNGDVRFHHGGTSSAPVYTVIAQDPYGANSQESRPKITFYIDPNVPPIINNIDDSEKTVVLNALMTSGIGAILGFSLFFLKVFLAKKAAKDLAKEMATDHDSAVTQYRRDVIQPLYQALSEHIKLAGFLGYVSESGIKNYILSMGVLASQLRKQGVDLELKSMATHYRTHLLDKIVAQTRESIISRKISSRKMTYFFKAEVNAQDIESHASEISKKVKLELDKHQSFGSGFLGKLDTVKSLETSIDRDGTELGYVLMSGDAHEDPDKKLLAI